MRQVLLAPAGTWLESLVLCAGLSARGGRGNISCHPAEKSLNSLAIVEPGNAAPGYFPSFRQVSQGRPDICQRNAGCLSNFRVKQLAVLFQALEDGGGMHFDYLGKNESRKSTARIEAISAISPARKLTKQKATLVEVASFAGKLYVFSRSSASPALE
jgi:hypothetical protein